MLVEYCGGFRGRRDLGGYVESSVWDVEVSDYEDEAGRHGECGGIGRSVRFKRGSYDEEPSVLSC